MAQRFGGKYSPGGDSSPASPPPLQDKRRSRAGFRSNLLFLLPFPFVISAFRAEPVGLALNLAAFGALLLAAWLTRDGILAQEAYEARRVARRPAIPRKIFGSVLTGLGLAAAGLADGNLIAAVIYAGLGAGLHLMAFGLDPMKNKGMTDADRFQSDRVARAVDEAEQHLSDMTEAIGRARDRQLEGRVERFKQTARTMFRSVEKDPRDLTAARKFLGVYLLAARDATVKFADLYASKRDAGAREDYERLLDDLETKFAAKTETFLIEDRSDLDVEISVLRDRLERENL